MEPFQLTRQSITFIALMAGVALVVALAAPFGSIALGAVALIAIGAVLTKAMLRTRRWWPLTAVEGTIALSSLVLLAGGAGVVGYSIVRLGDGWHMTIGWPSNEKVREGPFRAGRNAHIPDPELHQQFVGWLEKKGIKHEVVRSDGKDYIVWDQGGGDAVREFMESRGGAECEGKVAAGKPESGRC